MPVSIPCSRYTGVESKVYNEGFPLVGGKLGGDDEEEEECPPNLSLKSEDEGKS